MYLSGGVGDIRPPARSDQSLDSGFFPIRSIPNKIILREFSYLLGSWDMHSPRSTDIVSSTRVNGYYICVNQRPSHHRTAPLAPRTADSRYFIKFPFAVLLGIWSALFWRIPTTEDVVNFIEGTSLITVLRRDWTAERTALLSPGGTTCARSRSTEARHYCIRVDECMLECVTRERGGKCNEGTATRIRSWSMTYKKTRCGGNDDRWAVIITSFNVNGLPVADSESQISFLHTYLTASAHPKCHVFGNALVERILSDDSLKAQLMESTWTTTWLHHGLLHGCLGPLTSARYGERERPLQFAPNLFPFTCVMNTKPWCSQLVRWHSVDVRAVTVSFRDCCTHVSERTFSWS